MALIEELLEAIETALRADTELGFRDVQTAAAFQTLMALGGVGNTKPSGGLGLLTPAALISSVDLKPSKVMSTGQILMAARFVIYALADGEDREAKTTLQMWRLIALVHNRRWGVPGVYPAGPPNAVQLTLPALARIGVSGWAVHWVQPIAAGTDYAREQVARRDDVTLLFGDGTALAPSLGFPDV